jgi:hypothetical protein
MNPKKPPNIVWLASYPKSGNTWFRAFLTNLLEKPDQQADINNLYPTTIASSRQMFDEITGIPSADLTASEIDLIKPELYRSEAAETGETIFHKIHDAFTLAPDGNPLIPVDVTKAVLYFIRNPLDVAVSFANHLATNIDKTIRIMNNNNYAFCGKEDRLFNQTRQLLLSWSRHVQSWIDESKLPILVIRYEDMHTAPFETFKRATGFIGIEATDEAISKAIEKSAFENLKKQEDEKGFREKNISSGSFFRKGKAGDWKNVLTENQVRQLIRNHKKVMRRFGYFPVR